MNVAASHLLGLTGGAGVAACRDGGEPQGAAWRGAMVRFRRPFACALQKSFVEDFPS